MQNQGGARVCGRHLLVSIIGLWPAVLVANDELPEIELSADHAVVSEKRTPTQIEEIVVTATKRSRSVREIPLSIDAFDGEALASRGATRMEDILLHAPGVSLNGGHSPGNNQIQIRGTTTSSVTTTGPTPAGIFLGEVPLANASIVGTNPDIDPFDMATVEVLKGPQGTLFGGSALAGAVRYVPNPASSEAFAARLRSGLGQVSDSQGLASSLGLMINLPLHRSLAIRAMGSERRYPGAIDDLFDGRRDVDSSRSRNLRASLAWDPTGKLSVGGFHHHFEVGAPDSPYTDNPRELTRGNESGSSPQGIDNRITQIRADYEFEALSLVATAGEIRKNDFADVAADRLLGGQTAGSDKGVDGAYFTRTLAYELRLLSARQTRSDFPLFAGWEWMAGVFRYQSDQRYGIDIINESPPLPPQVALSALSKARAEESAFFADASWLPRSAMELNLGLRWFDQTTDALSTQSSNGVPVSEGRGAFSETGINPKFALTWHLHDGLNLRISAARGFRFGGVNAVAGNDGSIPETYDSDELWNYELGLRSQWWAGRLILDATAFLIDWKRVQIGQITPETGQVYTDNVGAARSQGAELATTLALPANLQLKINGAYVDARTAADFASNQGTIASGTRLPATPYVTGSMELRLQHVIGPLSLDGNLNWIHQGEAIIDLAHSGRIPAYQSLSLSLNATLREFSGSPMLGLHISNLTDRRSYATATPPVNGVSDFFPLRPRTITLELGLTL